MHESQTTLYDVALSFAGEDRPLAKQLATSLERCGIKVFFDEFESVNLFGKSLIRHLHSVYTEQARFCVPIISEAYTKKDFPRHEIQSALNRAISEREEYLLPIRLDSTPVEGLNNDIVYLDLRTTDLIDVVSIIVRKVSQSGGEISNLNNQKTTFTVHTQPTRLSASIAKFGKRSLIIALANSRGVFLSQDLGITAFSLAHGLGCKFRNIDFNYSDEHLLFYEDLALYIANVQTKKIVNVFSSLPPDQRGVAEALGLYDVSSTTRSPITGGTEQTRKLKKVGTTGSSDVYEVQEGDCLLDIASALIAEGGAKEEVSEDEASESVQQKDGYFIDKAVWSPASNFIAVLLRDSADDFCILILEVSIDDVVHVRYIVNPSSLNATYSNDKFPLRVDDIFWKPDGTEIGIVTGGADMRGFITWNYLTDVFTEIHDMRDGTGYIWIDIFHVLHLTAGADTHSMSILDLRDASERIIEKIGMYSTPIPSLDGRALFYSSDDDHISKSKQDNRSTYKIQIVNRSVSCPVVKTDEKVSSVSWSSDSSKIALVIGGDLYIANLPGFLG